MWYSQIEVSIGRSLKKAKGKEKEKKEKKENKCLWPSAEGKTLCFSDIHFSNLLHFYRNNKPGTPALPGGEHSKQKFVIV